MTQQSTKTFDAINLKILDQLQLDASLSNVELAQRVHLSPSPRLAPPHPLTGPSGFALKQMRYKTALPLNNL